MENRRKSKRGAANESNEDEEMAKSRKKHKEVFIYVMKELLTKASKKFLKFFRIRPAIRFKYDSKNKENKETKQQKQDKDSSCKSAMIYMLQYIIYACIIKLNIFLIYDALTLSKQDQSSFILLWLTPDDFT